MDQSVPILPSAEDRAAAVAVSPEMVSRETWGRLDRFVDLLLERQQRMNLIGASTIPHLWTRHVFYGRVR